MRTSRPSSRIRRRRRTSRAAAAPSSLTDIFTAADLWGYWSIDDVAGVADTEFTTWADASGNGRNLTRVGALGPTYRTADSSLGSLPVADFTTTSANVGATLTSLAQPFTLIAFGRAANGFAAGKGFIGNGNWVFVGGGTTNKIAIWAGGGYALGSNSHTNGVVLFGEANGASTKIYENGTLKTTANGGTDALNEAFRLGGDSALGMAGWHGNEFAVVSRALSADERTSLMSYFRTKSGLALT